MSDKKKILIVQNIHNAGIKLLEDHPNFEFEILHAEEMVETIDPELFKKKIAGCDGLTIRTEKLPGEIIEHAKKLKIISRHGVGYDNIDLISTKKNNITLAITATANAVAVAEHVMFMILNIAKRKNMYDDSVKFGKFYTRSKLPKTIEIWKKKILIGGFGRIGQSLIKRCLGFEMNVFVYDPYIEKDKIEAFGGHQVDDFKSAVKDMDIISIHMPLNEKTKNLINLDLLKTMKKNCILINAARGGIINEDDLSEALNKNYIFGAGLDVFNNEPPEKNNPLLKSNKVFLSPHTATFTEECAERMGIETIQNIIDFFDKKLEKFRTVIL